MPSAGVGAPAFEAPADGGDDAFLELKPEGTWGFQASPAFSGDQLGFSTGFSRM